MPSKQPTAPVVAVMNMKGGVGKTTIAANVFREVFRQYYKETLLVDFDPQFNLSQLLLSRFDYERLKAQKKTIYHVLEPESPQDVAAVSDRQLLSFPKPEEFTTLLKQISGPPRKELRLLAGNFQMAVLNLREKPESLRLPRERFTAYIEASRQKYELIVIDCNPSSSFVTRCALENCTHLLVPVRADKYSILGVEMIIQYLEKLRSISTKPVIKIVLNAFDSDAESLQIESQLRSHATLGPNVLINSLRYSGLLRARSGFTGFAVDRRVAYRRQLTAALRAVAAELAKEIGLSP